MTATTRFIPANAYDPWAPEIEGWTRRQLPRFSTGKTEDVMNAIMTEFLATREYRVGPMPNPESLVRMRDVVRRAVDAGRSIPVLIPSAAAKRPLGARLDVAELSFLRVLDNLHERVAKHYPPSMSFRVRMEDLTKLVITHDVPKLPHYLDHYITTMRNLVDVLGFSSFITIVPESDLADPDQFINAARDAGRVFTTYLNQTDDVESGLGSESDLHSIGWTGGVSMAMREFLRARYRAMYPNLEHAVHNSMIGEYLGSIVARRQLDAVGEDKSFTGRLELAFSNPMPDAPLVSTRIQYRTVPRSEFPSHAAFWAVKGYLEISEFGIVRTKLGNEKLDFTPGILEFADKGTVVHVKADYTFEQAA